jgi:CMP-N-acetylneuraminic acid synthetase
LKNIAIIPARGGSKRFVNKNIAYFNGLPLIAHSILYAQKFPNLISDIFVSTDDAKIEEVALNFGAKVVKRPSSLSGDFEPTVSALKNVTENVNMDFDNVILLQATNPLRPVPLLEDAIKLFCQSGSDSLFTVSRNYDKLGKIVNNHFEPFNYKIGQRSQDLEPLFFENGLLYISKKELIVNNIIIGDAHYPMVIDHPYASVDIDTPQDLIFAEFILKNTIV